MTKTKVTKKDYLIGLRKIIMESNDVNRVPLAAFIEKEMLLLDRRSERRAETKSKAAIENEAAAANLYDFLRNEGVALTTSDIIERYDAFKGFSPQKVTAIMKILLDNNQVARTYEKRKAYYLAV